MFKSCIPLQKLLCFYSVKYYIYLSGSGNAFKSFSVLFCTIFLNEHICLQFPVKTQPKLYYFQCFFNSTLETNHSC